MRVGGAELGRVPIALLEVIADELVSLDERGAMLVEPAREALVQLRARSLRQRLVGGIADEEVAEAEGVLADDLWRVGA